MIKAVLAAAMIVASAPAWAFEPAPAASQADEPSKPQKEKKICKREPISTSLHGSRRICKTAAQWRAEKKLIDEMNDPRGGTTRH
jgi:predicted secreted protein